MLSSYWAPASSGPRQAPRSRWPFQISSLEQASLGPRPLSTWTFSHWVSTRLAPSLRVLMPPHCLLQWAPVLPLGLYTAILHTHLLTEVLQAYGAPCTGLCQTPCSSPHNSYRVCNHGQVCLLGDVGFPHPTERSPCKSEMYSRITAVCPPGHRPGSRQH